MAGTTWQLWATAAALFAALTAVLAKVGVQGIEPNLATLLRTLVVAGVLAPWLLLSGQLGWGQLLALPTASVVALALSGLATGASWLCYFRALQAGPVAGVAALDKLSVVLVALLGFAVLGEQPGPRGWCGILLMAAGALLLAFQKGV